MSFKLSVSDIELVNQFSQISDTAFQQIYISLLLQDIKMVRFPADMVNITADMGSFPADMAKFSANMGSFPATNVNFLVITQTSLRWWVGGWVSEWASELGWMTERVNKWSEWSECVCVCVCVCGGGGFSLLREFLVIKRNFPWWWGWVSELVNGWRRLSKWVSEWGRDVVREWVSRLNEWVSESGEEGKDKLTN